MRASYFICADILEKVTDFMESALSFHDKVQFRFHLLHCSDCREYVAQMKQTVQVVHAVGKERPSASSLSPELKKTFQNFKTTRRPEKK